MLMVDVQTREGDVQTREGDVQTREGDSLLTEPKCTILITGTSGRIGYPLARRLAESFNVVGFDRRAPSHPPPSAECLYVDLTIDESLQRGLYAIRELHGNRPACVIHLAVDFNRFATSARGASTD
jgi:nucleoside-diphosphate-sugar epimerase